MTGKALLQVSEGGMQQGFLATGQRLRLFRVRSGPEKLYQ